MLFRGIILCALLVGVSVGVLQTGLQSLLVDPIIFASETYEVVEEASVVTHEHADGHHHDHEAWAPADGGERLFFTGLSNVLVTIGFAAMMLAVMCQTQLQGWTQVSVMRGALWGLAGFIAFFAAPGIGLPPEIPGIEAAVLENRQGWWMLTVGLFLTGLAILGFAPLKWKAFSIVLFAFPYLVGAPHVSGPEFTGEAERVAALHELHSTFIMASGIANLVFWLALGLACAWCVNRWVLKGASNNAAAHA